MRIGATHPPSPAAAARFRADGRWSPAGPADIAAGGSRPAVADADGVWSYLRLAGAAAAVGGLLRGAGVTGDDAVLIVAPLRNAAVAAYLGVVRHGSVAVLLDRRCGTADLEAAGAAARPRVALAFGADAERLGLARHCPVLCLDDLGSADPVVTPVDPDAAAAVVFTSGTTSTPKGVIHTVNSLRCGTANMVDALALGRDDTLFLSSPLASITGLLQVESALAVHGRVALAERFSPDSALDEVLAQGATVIGGAPVIAQTLFAEAGRRGVPELPLRCIALGGSMIPASVIEDATRFGVRAVRVYGSSEVPFSTSTALDDASLDDGAPLPGVDVAIGDDDELLISGPHQFHGYLDPAHNDGAFDGDWVRTGDQAELREGRIRITGRLKEVVNRKGMKISLAEIDAAASGLGECAAFSVPDAETGERLVLAARDDLGYPAVVEHLTRAGLAVWKLPEQVVWWDGDFPRTESGKVIRRALADESRYQRTTYAPRLSGQRI